MAYALGVIIGVAALAGAVLLGRVIVRAGGGRTAMWCVLLALAVLVADFLGSYAAVFYSIPPVWIAVVLIALVVVAVLFVRIAADVRWRLGPIAALIGLIVTVLIAVTVVQVMLPAGAMPLPFGTRAAQIAEANDFTALLPPGESMVTDQGRPVDPLEAPEAGLSVQYERFFLQERRASGLLDEAALRALVPVGEDPMRWHRPGIPADAVYTVTSVSGRPALAVEYRYQADAGKPGSETTTARLLVFEIDGVEVRMLSESHLQYQPNETYEHVDALGVDELVAIAETLAPVE